MSKIIYPHVISISYNRNKCDICQENYSTNNHIIEILPYFGISTCDNKKCINLCKESLEKNTISMKELKEKYNKELKVLRSNGKLEKGWIIDGLAYREEENGPFWVKVTKDYNCKFVSLDKLDVWNIN